MADALDAEAVTAAATKATILDDPAAMRAGRRVRDARRGRGLSRPDRGGLADLAQRSSCPGSGRASMALLGMGGSAIGGDLVKGIWSDRISVPMEIVRGYDLPAWVGRETLVIASSYSGSTEETISAFTAALERRCPVAVITTGGPLGEVARRAGLPLVTFTGAGSPRASVGYSMAILAGLLERTGVLALDEAEIGTGVEAAREMVARCDPGVPTADNPAKQLAWSLVDRLVVISGERRARAGGAALEGAAQRERQVGRGRRGAPGGDAQHGRRLRAARVGA